MILVECDLHTRKQQVALLNTATGELRDQELSHIGDDVERLFAALSRPVTVGRPNRRGDRAALRGS